MTSGCYRFEDFELDTQDRRLDQGGAPVALNARYLDALCLLVGERGRLISKDRFLEEVWNGTPVTDEALTQCIRTLRRALGDTASNPRFIETVPKHGYRFIAPVESVGGAPAAAQDGREGAGPALNAWARFLTLGAAGAGGGALAGLPGGGLYGFAAASQPAGTGVSGVSVLFVLIILTTIIALIGGAGVAFGVAAADFARARQGLWRVAGGAAGGMIVGAVVKLLGLDAFNLLFGHAPDSMTGAPEGALLGAAIGAGCWLGIQTGGVPRLRRSAAAAAVLGAGAGLAVIQLGGSMLGGSLVSLSRQFPDSRLSLDPIGALFGEQGFGPVSQSVTGALEGALFGGCVAAAMILAHRALTRGAKGSIAV